MLRSNLRARTHPLPCLIVAALMVLSARAVAGSGRYAPANPIAIKFLYEGGGSAIPGSSIGPMRQLPVPANPQLPTLFLIGDSTVRNGKGDGANGQWGWGDFMTEYFDTTRINVVNRALGGLSESHLPDARILGRAARDVEAGRCCHHAVWTQRQWTTQR